MRKKTFRSLLALPLLAACSFTGSAFAQGSVSIFGTLDMGVNRLKTTTAAGVTTSLTSMAGGGIQTPVMGFRGSEDLGSGLSATFNLATYLSRMDAGAPGRSDIDPFWAAGANVGLASVNWGSVQFGRVTTPTIVALFDTNAWLGSTTYGSAFVNHWAGAVQGDTGFSNAVRYDSPRVGGFQGQFVYSLGEERASGPDKRFGVGYDWRLDYLSGPLRATLSGRSINQSTNSNGREHTLLIAGASYDFGVVRAFAQYVGVKDRYTVDTANVDRTGINVGVRVPLGTAVLIASTARSKIDDVSAATPSRRNTTSIGSDFYLSKRTDLYVAYTHDRFTDPVGNKSTRFGAGIRHVF